MKIVGIVGGIASGKSTIADLFCEHDATFKINTDELLHTLIEQPDIQIQFKKRWHQKKWSRFHVVSREEISRIVWNNGSVNQDELFFVEDITLKPLIAMVQDKLFYYDNDYTKMIVLDAPLLFESDMEGFCDKIVFVSTPDKVRRDRALKRTSPRLSDKEITDRESLQYSIIDKEKRSDYIILNDETLELSKGQVVDVWEKIIASKTPRKSLHWDIT